jgi:hypothetical protein
MGYTDLLAALRRRPFEPFLMRCTDSTIYEVRHPDILIATPTGVVIGFPDPAHPRGALRYDIVGLEHIVRIEQLPQPAGKPVSEEGNGAGSA